MAPFFLKQKKARTTNRFEIAVNTFGLESHLSCT